MDVKIDEDVIKCDDVDELVVLSASCDGQKALDFIVERNKRVSREAACAAHMASQAASLYESRAKDQIEVAVSIRSKLEEEKEKDTEEETEAESENKEEENDVKSENKEKEKDKSENKEEDEDKSENKGEIERKTPRKSRSSSRQVKTIQSGSHTTNHSSTRTARGCNGTHRHRYMEFTTLHHTTVGSHTTVHYRATRTQQQARCIYV